MNNLEIIRYVIQSITGHLETDVNIWQGCRNKDIPRNIQQFIFKAIHSAHRIGDYWTTSPTSKTVQDVYTVMRTQKT